MWEENFILKFKIKTHVISSKLLTSASLTIIFIIFLRKLLRITFSRFSLDFILLTLMHLLLIPHFICLTATECFIHRVYLRLPFLRRRRRKRSLSWGYLALIFFNITKNYFWNI